MRVPQKWVVYNGQSQSKMDDLGVPILGNLYILQFGLLCWIHRASAILVRPAGWFVGSVAKTGTGVDLSNRCGRETIAMFF